MKYDLGSDLHVDINAKIGMVNFKKQKHEDSDTIVLAGDLSNELELTANVIAVAANSYKNVVFVDGNHEHYHGIHDNVSISEAMEYFKNVAKAIPNVTYLSGVGHTIIDGIMFAGVNAWYDFRMAPPQYSFKQQKDTWSKCLADARLSIFDMEPEVFAKTQTDFLAQTVMEAQENEMIEKIVIVTHTVPSIKGLLVKNQPTWDMLNGSFGCSVMAKVFNADVNRKIVHSVFGHTHYSYDFHDFDGVRFVANPRGYHGALNEAGDKWNMIQLDTDEDRP